MGWRPGLGLLLTSILLLPRSATAEWPTNPNGNLPICTAPGDQGRPKIIADGSGGAIVAWEDRRGTDWDIYAQHVLVDGTVDPPWPANGRALCTAINDQRRPELAPDGAGGAIVTWEDAREGFTKIYAQHILESGAVDPAWPADGREICISDHTQRSPCDDAASGALMASGREVPGWTDAALSTANKLRFMSPPGPEHTPGWVEDRVGIRDAIVDDGVGGAIVGWEQGHFIHCDIYAQHVLANGEVDPVWPPDGRRLHKSKALARYFCAIAGDGRGGAVVVFTEARGGNDPSSYDDDVFAQHVLPDGIVDPAWPANGRSVCTARHMQYRARIATVDSGGFIIVWQDYRNHRDSNIYAQRVRSDGKLGGTVPGFDARADEEAEKRVARAREESARERAFQERKRAQQAEAEERIVEAGQLPRTYARVMFFEGKLSPFSGNALTPRGTLTVGPDSLTYHSEQRAVAIAGAQLRDITVRSEAGHMAVAVEYDDGGATKQVRFMTGIFAGPGKLDEIKESLLALMRKTSQGH